MPNGTEVQVGFFWPQSKHIYKESGACTFKMALFKRNSYFIRWLRLELLEYLQRLLLGGKCRGHDCEGGAVQCQQDFWTRFCILGRSVTDVENRSRFVADRLEISKRSVRSWPGAIPKVHSG